MMKFSKTLMMVLGVVALLAFVGVMIYNVIEINQMHAVAIANRSTGFPNPRNWVLIGAALGLLAGLLLGVALALPNKTFKSRYAEVRKAEQIAEARAAGFTGSSSAPTDRHVTDPKPENAPNGE